MRRSSLLASAGDREVKVLAGGQSLLPVLRLRMAAPELIVDLSRIGELRGVRDEGEVLVVGAMTTHDDVTREPLVRQHALLLAEAARTVADPQIRHRGTFGGSLAHADPAGDMPAAALALDAEMVIAGPSGRRTVPAAEFFVDLFTTALAEDELLVEVRVPKHTGWGAHYEKFSPVAQAWSIVAVAATVRVEGGRSSRRRRSPSPTWRSCRCGRPPSSRRWSGGRRPPRSIREAAAMAADGTSPMSDVTADEEYRRHLATVLTGRACWLLREPDNAGAGRSADRPARHPPDSRRPPVELQHTFTVPAPVDEAWSTLLDVEGIAPCFPGATLTGVDGDSFSGTVKVKLGPVSLQYAGKGHFVERDEAARRVVLEANGSDKRGNGTAAATVQARLEPIGDAETRVVVDTDLKVTGRPAQFGRGMLQDVSGRIIEQFASCLATRMSAPGEITPGEITPGETTPG